MDKHTKLAVAGVAIAALIAGAGAAYTHRLESRLVTLQTECQRLSPEERKLSFRAICDVWSLRGTGELQGTQAEIVAAHDSIAAIGDWPYIVALAVLVALALPWAWYFVLRRIRELRDAIAGK